MKISCCDCGAVDVEGEVFQPYQVVDLPDDSPILVCSDCEKLPAHQTRVEQTDINLRADASYQEWMEEQRNTDD